MAAMAIARDGMRSRQPRGAREQAHRRWVLGHEWLAPGGGASWRWAAWPSVFQLFIYEVDAVVIARFDGIAGGRWTTGPDHLDGVPRQSDQRGRDHVCRD